jgi:hypothetical protein
MTESKECSPHGWTLDTLEKYLSSRLDSVKENVTLAMVAAEKALTRSDAALEKRLDIMNEFRAALSDQSKLWMPRSEYDVQHTALNEKVNQVQHAIPRAEFDVQHQALAERVTDTQQRISKIENLKEGNSSGIGLVGTIYLGIMVTLAAFTGVGALFFAILRSPH